MENVKAEQSADTTAEQGSASKRATLSSGRGGIFGIKAGMTQVYSEQGDLLAVTVIDLKPAVVTQVKTNAKDGYQGVQVGIAPRKEKSVTMAEKGHFTKSGNPGYYHTAEIRFDEKDKLDGIEIGQILSPEFLKPGDLVDLTAMSKGKGFQGGMKRFHMAGGFKTHGASVVHRSLGSIGNRADPGKCFKNKKMPGRMGHIQVTVQNVPVVAVDVENQLLLVQGSVPGPKSTVVKVRRAVKAMRK